MIADSRSVETFARQVRERLGERSMVAPVDANRVAVCVPLDCRSVKATATEVADTLRRWAEDLLETAERIEEEVADPIG